MILRLSLTKLLIEKKAQAKGKINIKSNVILKEVKLINLKLGVTDHKVLNFVWEYQAFYEPKIAEIIFNGELALLEEPEVLEKIESAWKKDKQISKEVMVQVLNSIYSKCNIEALILSKEMSLPPPVPLPKVTAN